MNAAVLKTVELERAPGVRIPPPPPLPCREPAIGRPQARKAPSSRAIFQMPSEPRRLGDTSKAVSERLLSLITRTPPPAVRVQNSLRLPRFEPIDGPEVRGRYSTQCAVRETKVEVLARNSGRACPSGRQSPAWSTALGFEWIEPLVGARCGQPGKGPLSGSGIKTAFDGGLNR